MKTLLTFVLACFCFEAWAATGTIFSNITRTNSLLDTNLFLISPPTRTIYFSDVRTAVATNLGAATAITLDSGLITAKKAFQVYQGALAHAGTVTLDFNAATTVNALALTGNVTFATSNLATNRTYRVKIAGTSTNCTATFPATWNFLGGAPTTITASKTSMLSLEAWGTTDATVVAAFAETP